MVHMKATSSSAMIVKKTGIEQYRFGDIVQWSHEQKGRTVTAYGEVTSIMKKNMWVNLLGKEWKVSIQDASLIYRPELKEIE